MDSLSYSRDNVLNVGIEGAVQSVAGFASLHCAITLLVALMVQFTLRSQVLKWVFWVNFGLTVVATLYFGWHYIADDVAGIMIALISFYVGGIASGQKFDRHGRTSHPDDRRPRPCPSSRKPAPADRGPIPVDPCADGRPPGTRREGPLRDSVHAPARDELQPCSSSRRHAGSRRKSWGNCFFCD